MRLRLCACNDISVSEAYCGLSYWLAWPVGVPGSEPDRLPWLKFNINVGLNLLLSIFLIRKNTLIRSS